MTHAAKALAMTMVDLFEKPKLVDQVKQEYIARKGDEVYKALVPDGPPPIQN